MKTITRLHRRSAAFTLLELLIVIGIVGMLAALALPSIFKSQRMAERADSTARLRSMSQGIMLYVADHEQTLPGPLWPGQVMLYDPAREGRLVRDLADYLSIENKPSTYLVQQMIPKAYRRAMQGTKLEDVRIYVMNSSVTLDGGTVEPFASTSITAPDPGDPRAPVKVSRMQALPPDDNWMMGEADQTMPDVSGAPWKANTPAGPVHGNVRALAKFDGSVVWETIP